MKELANILDRIASPRRCRGRGQRKFEAFGHIIFDEETCLSNGGRFGIGKRLDTPSSRCAAGEQRQRKAATAVANRTKAMSAPVLNSRDTAATRAATAVT